MGEGLLSSVINTRQFELAVVCLHTVSNINYLYYIPETIPFQKSILMLAQSITFQQSI